MTHAAASEVSEKRKCCKVIEVLEDRTVKCGCVIDVSAYINRKCSVGGRAKTRRKNPASLPILAVRRKEKAEKMVSEIMFGINNVEV